MLAGRALGTSVTVTAVLHRFGPKRRQQWRCVWPGAMLTTALWLAATLAFGWYVQHLARYRDFLRQHLGGGGTAYLDVSPLSTLQSAGIVLPTTDGHEIRLRRITEPTQEQKRFLERLGIIPRHFHSNQKCSAARIDAVPTRAAALLEDFVEDHLMKDFPVPRGE